MKEKNVIVPEIARVEKRKSATVNIECLNCHTKSLRVVTFYNIDNYANGLTQDSALQHVKAQISASVGICSGCHKGFHVSDAEMLKVAKIIRDGKEFDSHRE